jgi:hypothetical protein
MVYVAREIEDKRVLTLIRRYLEAGPMSGGLVSRQQEGRRKAARARRCCRIFCSTNSTEKWTGGVIASCTIPTTRTFMRAVVALARG